MEPNRFNPWHSVSYGDNVPNTVNAIIEIPPVFEG